ncbi:MAG: (deoxy)nucleoside triphosphate pyrophosphohydrolase [Alphaproteobacteria bacterium]|nr:(deoxy)nucleoside triphosphate pyrophosphohydrolase [Alphaproteobacteria bacterium]
MNEQTVKRDVAAGLIMCGDKILIGQRKRGKSLEYKWEFPGGKLEPGETLQECLHRELMEEMHLDIAVKEHFMDSEYTYDFGTIVLHAFWAACNNPNVPAVLEHEQYKWVMLDELARYDFAPADKPIIDAIMKNVKK